MGQVKMGKVVVTDFTKGEPELTDNAKRVLEKSCLHCEPINYNLHE